jgi:hypothetical protein
MEQPVFTGQTVNPDIAIMPGQILPVNRQDEIPEVMNIIVVQQDNKKVTLTLSINGYEGLDLNSATIEFIVKKSPQDPEANTLLEKSSGDGITVIDAEKGIISIDFVPADTADIEPLVPMTCDVRVTTGASEVYTISRGVFTVSSKSL